MNFDWGDYIPKPIEQGDCGSCYLISTLQMLESRIRIKYNKTVTLSTGYLIDCNFYS